MHPADSHPIWSPQGEPHATPRKKTLLCAGLCVLGTAGLQATQPPAPVPTVAPTAPAAASPPAAAVPGGPKGGGARKPPRNEGVSRQDYAGAAAAFRAAIAADASHVLAHYNLACVLALTGDKAGAVAMLGGCRAAPIRKRRAA